MTILPLLAFLATGVVLGLLWRHPRLKAVAGFLQKFGVFLLVFCMGLSLGTQRDIVDNLATVGWQALVMAVFVVLGSVLCTWGIHALTRAMGRRKTR